MTPLFYAAKYGHASVAKILLDAGADKNKADEVRPVIPLQCALMIL